MTTTKEKMEVMQAYLDGKKIQVCHTYPREHEEWVDVNSEPSWDWFNWSFRVKPSMFYTKGTCASPYLLFHGIESEVEGIVQISTRKEAALVLGRVGHALALTKEQVQALVSVLQNWVVTGELKE